MPGAGARQKDRWPGAGARQKGTTIGRMPRASPWHEGQGGPPHPSWHTAKPGAEDPSPPYICLKKIYIPGRWRHTPCLSRNISPIFYFSKFEKDSPRKYKPGSSLATGRVLVRRPYRRGHDDQRHTQASTQPKRITYGIRPSTAKRRACMHACARRAVPGMPTA